MEDRKNGKTLERSEIPKLQRWKNGGKQMQVRSFTSSFLKISGFINVNFLLYD